MDELISFTQKSHIPLEAKQIEQFKLLLTELVAWNAHTNLTAIRTDEEIVKKHFIDSVTIIPHLPPDTLSLIDIGTGAGFPGLPIKILRPEIQVTLLDSIEKKTIFHTHIIEKLELQKISTVNARVEDIAHQAEYRENFNVVTARAVANLSTLLEYAIPLLKVGGICIAQKSINDSEIMNAQNALKELNAEIKELIPVDIDGLTPRQLLIIKKNKKTAETYPRSNGIPLKKHL